MADVVVKPWKKELPTRPGGPGKERRPSPYDDVVAKSWADAQAGPDGKLTGAAFCIEKVGDPGSDDRKAHARELRRAAEFVGCGLDIWPDQPEGIVFVTRTKREKPAPKPKP